MKKTWYSYPYLVWMAIFIVVPFLLLLFYSFTASTDQGIVFTLDHVKRLWDPIYLMVLLRSINLALICTIICLIVGYPVSLILASKEYSSNKVLALLFVIPMWINFLLRTYAWMTLLEKDGLVYTILNFCIFPIPALLYTVRRWCWVWYTIFCSLWCSPFTRFNKDG